MKIIKIGALWCPGCLVINSSINKIKKKYPNLEVIEYDYDFDLEVSIYNVGNILPVLIFMTNDKEYSRLIGERSYEEIESEIMKGLNI